MPRKGGALFRPYIPDYVQLPTTSFRGTGHLSERANEIKYARIYSILLRGAKLAVPIGNTDHILPAGKGREGKSRGGYYHCLLRSCSSPQREAAAAEAAARTAAAAKRQGRDHREKWRRTRPGGGARKRRQHQRRRRRHHHSPDVLGRFKTARSRNAAANDAGRAEQQRGGGILRGRHARHRGR